MSIERVFLDWDKRRAALGQAADWLAGRYPRAGAAWDLGNVTIVTPGARAGRRLVEILVDQSQGCALTPPRTITLGALPELLYASSLSTSPGGALTIWLARARALQKAAGERLACVVPNPPRADDLAGWLALAQMVHRTYEDLAAERLTFAAAAAKLQTRDLGYNDERRWAVLAELQQAYEQILAHHDLHDVHQARQAALAGGGCRAEGPIVLIGTADLSGIVGAMLQQAAAAAPDRITALIHAPPALADHFEDTGGLRAAAWQQRPLDLDEESIRIVDRPRDQAFAVMRALAELGDDPPYALDQVTVGLGDEALGPVVARALELAGVATHRPDGRSLGQSPPVLLLGAIGRFVSSRRFSDFAALLRHPDAEAYVWRQAGHLEDEQLQSAIDDWLTVLDTYVSNTIQRKLTGRWLGDPEIAEPMQRVHDCIQALIPEDADRRKPLPQWAGPLADMLLAFYRDRQLQRFDATDAVIIDALDAIRDALREIAALDAQQAFVPAVDFAQAVAVVLAQLAGGQSTPAPAAAGAAVELLGYLELQLDDVPVLAITGMNEGAVPQSQGGHLLLPNTVRQVLGLADNDRRYARDRLALEAIVQSRPHVTLIAGRRNAEDDPLRPGRLLLACDEATLPARIGAFYPRDPAREADTAAPVALPSGAQSQFGFIPPQPVGVLTRLRVTAFRDYIACPYRFYLRHVLHLGPIDDRTVEMDGASFGTLAHEVLQRFALGSEAGRSDAAPIFAFLEEQLEQRASEYFGKESPAAVRLQIEQLRNRLEAYARWQAKQTRAGWRIMPAHVEQQREAQLDVDGAPFTITGKIDRIDEHPELGYRVIDFKTADTAKSPDKQHRTGQGDWVDLQLPLYRELAHGAGIAGPTELGYVQLPKNLTKIEFAPAEWNDALLDSAVDYAKQIISEIRAGRFWKPGDPPTYADGLAAICMDNCLDRTAAIERASGQVEGGGNE